jgi:hypothetical protein
LATAVAEENVVVSEPLGDVAEEKVAAETEAPLDDGTAKDPLGAVDQVQGPPDSDDDELLSVAAFDSDDDISFEDNQVRSIVPFVQDSKGTLRLRQGDDSWSRKKRVVGERQAVFDTVKETIGFEYKTKGVPVIQHAPGDEGVIHALQAAEDVVQSAS